MKGKIFKNRGVFGEDRQVEIIVTLPLYIDDDIEEISVEDVISLAYDESRKDLGELVLNALDKAVVITE
jgi:hypothetical protein